MEMYALIFNFYSVTYFSMDITQQYVEEFSNILFPQTFFAIILEKKSCDLFIYLFLAMIWFSFVLVPNSGDILELISNSSVNLLVLPSKYISKIMSLHSYLLLWHWSRSMSPPTWISARVIPLLLPCVLWTFLKQAN